MRLFWIGVLCVWCVNGAKMQSIVVGERKNDTNSDEIQIGSSGNENTRQTRQLDPGAWTPIPAVWSPRPRSPLNTWWAMQWPFMNGQSFVRVQPPSPYWEDYHHHHHDHHHDHHVSIRKSLKITHFWPMKFVHSKWFIVVGSPSPPRWSSPRSSSRPSP